MKPLFRIKICGIRRLADAQAAADAGADAIGLNFYPGSSRCVTLATAQAIRTSLPSGICCVGVFVNAEVSEVIKTAAEVGLDALQFHGDEPPEYLAAIREAGGGLSSAPIIRAFRCRDGDYQVFSDYVASVHMDGPSNRPEVSVLIDAFVEGKYGGGGETIDWQAFHDARSRFHAPLILAGGLTANNVARAIEIARPDAVDVASGVESSPGQKDRELVRQFVENARRAFANAAP
jgi:phosphoribosylanthranilate isomerase